MKYHRNMTTEETKEYLTELLGPPKRELEGTEYEEARTLLTLANPFNSSDNQHVWSDEFWIGEVWYEVIQYPGADRPIISIIEGKPDHVK